MQTAGVLILSAQEGPNRGAKKSKPEANSDAKLRSRLACVEILGRSVLLRTLDRLKAAAIEPVTILSNEVPAPSGSPAGNVFRIEDEAPFRVRPVVEQFAQEGAQLIVCFRLGPYAEIDFAELLRFHTQKQANYTTAYYDGRPLPVFVTDLKRPSRAISALLDWLDQGQIPCARFPFRGCVNWLDDPRDFRQLAREGLLRKCELQPVGAEVRPGVWIGEGAEISNEARILAPAYVGANCVVHKGVLITRASNIERDCKIDPGTTLEDSTLLPGTLVGPGLRLASVVAEGPSLHDLRRQVSIDVEDKKLLGRNSGEPVALRKLRSMVPALFGRAGRTPTGD